MKHENPFPGMNPWMQGVWSDMHTRLIGYIADALADELPDDLLARAEENISLASAGEEEQVRRADVAVVDPDSWKRGESPVWTPASDPDLASRVAVPVPVRIQPAESVTPRWVEIQSASGELVTVIEVTSPANKTPRGRVDIEQKLQALLAGGVNVMEIDLVRGGQSVRDVRSADWPESTFQVVVNRAGEAAITDFYPCELREPLPAVRVPLRENEPDAALDLQPLVNQCYSRGRYWMLPYGQDPQPAMTDDDLQWSRGIVRQSGLNN